MPKRQTKPAIIPLDQLPVYVARKVQEGHSLYEDPFGHSQAERWTCENCGNAVLSYCGNVYGSVTEAPCTGKAS